MLLNDGAEFANDPNLKAGITPYSNQPGSTYAGFIYDYVQFTDSAEEKILNGTVVWSKWQLLPDPWNKSNVHFVIKDQSVGVKRIFMRYRAIKKLSDATPSSYGDAMYHYGRSSKTTGIYYVDEIFFDNVPPVGGVTINNGVASTTSRTGSLQIWASDEVDGVMGSGLNGMRITNNCNLNDPDSNNWSEWQAEVTNKTGFNLGSGSIMVVCVQVRDKAGNVATFSDAINFIQIFVGSNPQGVFGVSVGYGIGTPDNKFAGKTAADFRKPWIEFDRYIDPWAISKWNSVKGWDMPEPEITYVDRIDETTVEVSGVAIRKWNPVNVIVNNEFRYCPFTCGSDWEKFIGDRSIEHVKVQILTEDGDLLKEFWNDDSLGRWQFKLTFGGGFNETDKIYAKVITYGKHYFDNLHWYEDTFENQVEFVAWDLWSGDSRHENIPFYSELLKAAIWTKYGLKVIDGDQTWKSSELEFVVTLLDSLPESFYRHPYIKDLGRYGEGGTTLGSYSPSTYEMKFYNKMFNNFPTSFTEYGYVDGKLYASLVFVHEMAHAWEEIDKAKGAPVLSAFSDISWVKSSEIYEKWAKEPSAKDTIVDYDGKNITYNDFVNDYASKYSYEDWAESVAVYKYLSSIFDKGSSLLKSKQFYSSQPF